ncbi:MAG: hypothetical protein LBJ44_11990 [Propionibacteriaceae bacterium]|nr:hypothetical protein [Propionibacteriaceae bacterium]
MPTQKTNQTAGFKNTTAATPPIRVDTNPRNLGITDNANPNGRRHVNTGSANDAKVNSKINKTPKTNAATAVTSITKPAPGEKTALKIPKNGCALRFPNDNPIVSKTTSRKLPPASRAKLSPNADAPADAITTTAGTTIATGTNTAARTPAARIIWIAPTSEPSDDFAVTNNNPKTKMMKPAPNATW